MYGRQAEQSVIGELLEGRCGALVVRGEAGIGKSALLECAAANGRVRVLRVSGVESAQRLEDNKRYASRNSKIPSLLQSLAACTRCGYGYYRTSTRTATRKICCYRCLGSDDYRYEGGRVCANKPVHADYLDTVVWGHVTGLLADPCLIRTEIDTRLIQDRTSDPARQQREQFAITAISRMIEAFSEQLITIDELRSKMPDVRAREANLHGQFDALDSRLYRPRRLPQARRRLRRLPHPAPHQRRRLRTPACPAAARQGRPHRTGEDHHPPPHPGPGTHRWQQPRTRPQRHGG
ncbi:zinc ribbon domain-containing protein [Nonomuraea diastatica]|uniref:ATP-binding protein n=1 Tax=Nonomuraea diastatica TaxID=1848329 RepID=A0A4V2YDV1_9ACTN|nr:recombinase zinc beta ribbon domain-containing protein [Nonomuraea diastatica]TDD16826.1 hypothetical protein E1294_30100 [Nonomuraea diastatica]